MQSMVDILDLNVIGSFLYGSQNYGLAHEDSDVDTILLVLSSDVPRQELTADTGKMKIYTLKYFINRLKSGDMECYEILYTRHRTINPVYEKFFDKFVAEFSECMSYDRIKCSLRNKLDEHLRHVFWLIRNDDGGRYSKKRLYWAIRVHNQLDRIVHGESFESSLKYDFSCEYNLIKIKTVPDYLSIRDVNIIYKYLVDYTQSFPRYSKDISGEEEECLSDFYTNMNLYRKGGS